MRRDLFCILYQTAQNDKPPAFLARGSAASMMKKCLTDAKMYAMLSKILRKEHGYDRISAFHNCIHAVEYQARSGFAWACPAVSFFKAPQISGKRMQQGGVSPKGLAPLFYIQYGMTLWHKGKFYEKSMTENKNRDAKASLQNLIRVRTRRYTAGNTVPFVQAALHACRVR